MCAKLAYADMVKDIPKLLRDSGLSSTGQKWQERAAGYLLPILGIYEHPVSYGLATRDKADIKTAQTVLADFLQEPVRVLHVDTDGLTRDPDWANYFGVKRSLHEVIFVSGSGPGPGPQSAMTRMNAFMKSINGRYGRRAEYDRICYIIESCMGEIARKLSNDVGAFRWINPKGHPTDGPLALCDRNLTPVCKYYVAAVMSYNRPEAELAAKLLTVLRRIMIIGEKTIEPRHWYMLTKGAGP